NYGGLACSRTWNRAGVLGRSGSRLRRGCGIRDTPAGTTGGKDLGPPARTGPLVRSARLLAAAAGLLVVRLGRRAARLGRRCRCRPRLRALGHEAQRAAVKVELV